MLYPNPDGSGPQADSLAAAIYGVAIPPGFGQFTASDNYFGGQGGFHGGEIRAQPSDLLVGTGMEHFLRVLADHIELTSCLRFAFEREGRPRR